MAEDPLRTLGHKLLNIASLFFSPPRPVFTAADETRAVSQAGDVIVENPRPRPRLEVLAYSAFFTPVLMAALIGIYLRRRDLLRRDAMLWCVIGTFVAIHALYFPATRYRAPVEFVLLFYAAAALYELFRRALLPALDWATVLAAIGSVLEDAMHARYLVAAGGVLAATLLIAAPAAAQSRAVAATAHAGREARPPGHLHVPDDHAAPEARGPRGQGQADARGGGQVRGRARTSA